MLSKVFTRMFSTTPNVWVNKHTKVICQGITGNQVNRIPLRELSKRSRPSNTGPRWSVGSIPKKQGPPISDFPSSRIVYRPKRRPVVMPLSFMFLLLAPQTQ